MDGMSPRVDITAQAFYEQNMRDIKCTVRCVRRVVSLWCDMHTDLRNQQVNEECIEKNVSVMVQHIRGT
jgi:hypothetical protein